MERKKDEDLKQMEKDEKARLREIQDKETEEQKVREAISKAGPPPKDIDDKIKKLNDEIGKFTPTYDKADADRKARREHIKTLMKRLEAKDKQVNATRDPRQVKLDLLRGSNYTEPLWRVNQWLGQYPVLFSSTQFDACSL